MPQFPCRQSIPAILARNRPSSLSLSFGVSVSLLADPYHEHDQYERHEIQYVSSPFASVFVFACPAASETHSCAHIPSPAPALTDAIVNSGIPITNRYEIPEELIPADSRVEIDAKIQAGTCRILLSLPNPRPVVTALGLTLSPVPCPPFASIGRDRFHFHRLL